MAKKSVTPKSESNKWLFDKIDALPPTEQKRALDEVYQLLLGVIYTKILPKMPLDEQIRVLTGIDKMKKGLVQPDIADDFTNEALAQVEEILR